jgi:hypothetical protein
MEIFMRLQGVEFSNVAKGSIVIKTLPDILAKANLFSKGQARPG